jgi:hypothetical protein
MNRTSRFARLAGGISIGSNRATAGTLSGIFIDAYDGSSVLVSNWHVFEGAPGITPILQPGVADGGSHPSDTVGKLKRYVALRGGEPPLWRRILCTLFGWLLGDWCLASNEANFVDVACASFEPCNPREIACGVYLDDGIILCPVNTHPGDGVAGCRAWKCGRTTGVTVGRILSDSATLKVWYGDRYAIFTDQIIVEGESGPGDSGSPVFLMKGDRPSGDDALIGLLFAGSGGLYVVCKWKHVRSMLGVEWPGKTLNK